MAEGKKRKRMSPYRFFLWGLFLTCALLIGILHFYFEMRLFPSYLIAINISLFFLFGYDKKISPGKSTRVPELVLCLSAALGGSLALLLGMKIFRHKTQSPKFQFVLGVILLTQLLSIGFYLSKN